MIINFIVFAHQQIESSHFEESPCFLPQQDQELVVVYLPVSVQVGLIDHLLHVHILQWDRVQPHDRLDVRPIELPIFIWV